MKISRKSWHYRLWSFFRPDCHEPTNLCAYFWQVALFVFFVTALTTAACFGVPFILYTVFWTYAAVTFTFIGVSLAVALLWIVVLARRLWFLWRPATTLEYQVAATIVVAYLKAKKQRLCPLIEVVDE